MSCWVCFTAPAGWELAQEPNGRKQGAKGHPGFGDKGNLGSRQGPGEQQGVGDPQGMFLASEAGEMGSTHVQSSPTGSPSTPGGLSRAVPWPAGVQAFPGAPRDSDRSPFTGVLSFPAAGLALAPRAVSLQG